MKQKIITIAPEFAEKDSHLYFRGRFTLSEPGPVTIQISGGGWFESWLDNNWLTEGPSRFDPSRPEYEERQITLEAGEHILSVHLHYEGVETRIMQKETPLFLFAELYMTDIPVPVDWCYFPLEDAYKRTGRRIDLILGWVEWCQTDQLPMGWQSPDFDDSGWELTVNNSIEVELFSPVSLAPVKHITHALDCIAQGPLVNMCVFTHDPTAGFMSRRLDGCEDLGMPPQGRWFRFDLGKVMLGRPCITLHAAAGTVVQIAYTEFLNNGRVSPYISSSAGDPLSCNLDHFILRGGRQTVKPLHPKGGRFIEVHIIGRLEEIHDVEFIFEERTYYEENIEGSFSCSDEQLNRIWTVGVETLRSCSEDAITDNPTRERGQWLGDAVGAGMDLLAVSYADMRPLKRGLLQAAECAGEDGMVPAVFPGTRVFLPSFAVQWTAAVPHYYSLTGDFQTLEKLYPAAVRNIRCFDPDLCDSGLRMNPTRWNFIDWGYYGASSHYKGADASYTEMDPALSFFYLQALEAMARWAEWLGEKDDVQQWRDEFLAFKIKMATFLERIENWEDAGYHTAALALRSGLVSDSAGRNSCIAFIKTHILSCFPNNPEAPRLSDVTVENSQLITPFFSHHVFPALIEAGEMDFVFDQFRACWGYWLQLGLTTWPEVFDFRWSHCHQWSGCPTWILSRYVLGLHPCFDRGVNHYQLKLFPGMLDWAKGTLPVPYRSEKLFITWCREKNGIKWELKTDMPVWLSIPGAETPVLVKDGFQISL